MTDPATRLLSPSSPNNEVILYPITKFEILEEVLPPATRFVDRGLLEAGFPHLLLPDVLVIGIADESENRQARSYVIEHFGHWRITESSEMAARKPLGESRA